MVTYEVTAIVETRMVEAFERYMREQHIPEVLASGCFQEAVFTRATPGRYRIRYEALGAEDVESYLVAHAPPLREEFAARFPEGVTLSREVWATIQDWTWKTSTPR